MQSYNTTTSVVECVNLVIQHAITQGASDIHARPTHDALALAYRIDGILIDQVPLAKSNVDTFIARVKIIAHLNVAEKRIPQDGRFSYTMQDQNIDIRVSTFPALFGEKIVMRILNRKAQCIDIQHLGLSDTTATQLKKIIKKPTGFFIVTGPTGCGKTTTLYAILQSLRCAQKNIITLEDPVEYVLHGITQGHIHPDTGFSFELGIRALLRQDPDIIMIGEIRDKQSAHIAIQAALTGHLVLTTMHTSDSVSALIRLVDMAIEPFLLNAAVTGVLAQRLVRTVCTLCKADENKIQYCKSCNNTGLKGRCGIFELLEPSDTFKELLLAKASYHTLKQQALDDGLIALQVDGAGKVKNNIVTSLEMNRVLYQ